MLKYKNTASFEHYGHKHSAEADVPEKLPTGLKISKNGEFLPVGGKRNLSVLCAHRGMPLQI